MKQVMSSILLLFLLNLVMTATTARSEGNCPVVPGLPGRDGRDGAPGRDGPPGPPGTFFYSELIAITKELREQMQTIDADSLTKDLEKKANCSQDLGRNRFTPAMSCLHIYQCEQSPPSGLYWIVSTAENETNSTSVYCDMDNWHSSSKGWARIAYINMTEDGATCPDTLRQITSPKKLCARTTSGGASCSSITFPTHGMIFNKICGQAKGYQKGSPDAFHLWNTTSRDSINSYFVDGMCITYGSPRKHIWTYAAGLSDDHNYNGRYNCPCAKYPGPAPPSFVGDHYYCESGNMGRFDYTTVYINDPLWDGEGCGADNNCCAQPGMPWFCRTLPQEVEGDIEVRLCADQATSDEDLYLELLEIYLQ